MTQQPGHCEHERVCEDTTRYLNDIFPSGKSAVMKCKDVMQDFKCPHDTRTRPHTTAPCTEQVRTATLAAYDDSHIELIAAIEHGRWVKWASEIERTERISSSRHMRWKKLMVPYDDLPNEMKEEDRKYARIVLKSLAGEQE